MDASPKGARMGRRHGRIMASQRGPSSLSNGLAGAGRGLGQPGAHDPEHTTCSTERSLPGELLATRSACHVFSSYRLSLIGLDLSSSLNPSVYLTQP